MIVWRDQGKSKKRSREATAPTSQAKKVFGYCDALCGFVSHVFMCVQAKVTPAATTPAAPASTVKLVSKGSTPISEEDVRALLIQHGQLTALELAEHVRHKFHHPNAQGTLTQLVKKMCDLKTLAGPDGKAD